MTQNEERKYTILQQIRNSSMSSLFTKKIITTCNSKIQIQVTYNKSSNQKNKNNFLPVTIL